MSKSVREKWSARFDEWILWLLLLVAAASCVSEPLARNAVRVILVLAAVRLSINRDGLEKLSPFRSWWAAMVALFAVMTASAIYAGYGKVIFFVEDFRHIFYLMLLPPIMIIFVPNQKKLRLLLIMLTVSLAAVDCHVFFEWNAGNMRPTSWIHASFMLTGMFYCLILPIMLAFALKRDESTTTGHVFVALAVVSFAALILTGTRAALLTMVVVCPLMILTNADDLRKTAFFLAISGFVLAAATISLPQTNARMQTAFDMNYQSNSERLLVWQSSLEMFRDHPFFGVGLGNFKGVYDAEYASPDSVEDLKHSHSNYLQFLTETGAVGLIVYLWLMGSVLIRLWRERKRSIYIAAAFFSVLSLAIFSATDYTLLGFSGMRIHWLVVGAAAVVERLTST